MMNKALLSKLMAREDLEVIEGNFKTASFDPKNRVVRLPLLKEEFNDAATLFIGHEIGHALYTPDFFSHEKTREDIADIPFDIINIVEDVRIERKVREFYPGLVNDFLKGYKRLMADDFFSVKNKDQDELNKLKFLDRLNLKAKLNDSIDVDFSLKETLMIAKVNAAQTFEDTIAVSREVMAFIKEQQQEEQDQEVEEKASGDDQQDLEEQGQKSDEDQTSVSSEEKDAEEETNTEAKGSLEEDETEEEDKTDYSSDTDRSMRKNESKMIHNDNITTFVKVTKAQLKEFIYSDEEFEKSAKVLEERYSGSQDYYEQTKQQFSAEYSSFINDVKPSVNAMVQQFELRKSAMESKKIRESTSGSVDVNKLWQYKLDDRIFKTVMSVPDAKNHGLLMYIDYSSSMTSRLHETLKQSIILSMFAKRVGIPFELYGFTTNPSKYREEMGWDRKSEINVEKGGYLNWAVKLVKIADSKWSKSKMHEMFRRSMFASWTNENRGPVESAFSLGGTPLAETISMAHIMADDFVKRNHIQKMNVVFLTDGAAQDMRLSGKLDNWAESIIWDIEGIGKVELTQPHNPYVSYERRSSQAKTTLLNSLRKKYNVIGFFLTDRRKDVDSKKGYHVWNDYGGYDSFITVHDKRLQAINDEFVSTADHDSRISSNATDRKRMNVIKRDFKKFQKNKKMNKLIAQEFARLVA
jgi:hypothetical protein